MTDFQVKTAELAAFLNLSVERISILRRSGRLPPASHRGATVSLRDNIHAYIAMLKTPDDAVREARVYKARLLKTQVIRSERQLKREAGELASRKELALAMAAALTPVHYFCEGLRDALESHCGMTPEQVRGVRRLTDGLRNDVYTELKAFISTLSTDESSIDDEN